MADAPSPAPAPAATVVILRPAPDSAEVLLIHRPTTMAFGPGLHVMPGGKVDPEDVARARRSAVEERDRAAVRLGENVPPIDALALHLAACREVQEEVGVALDPTELVPIAHWTTPRFMARRFSTWFFVADLPAGTEPVFQPDEVAAHRWLTPRGALDTRATGEIEMWVPTTSVLERLIDVAADRAGDVGDRVRLGRVVPPRVVAETMDRTVIESTGAGGLPGRTCRTSVIGRRELVVVDPGDPAEAAIEAIDAVAARRRGTIRAVVLTRPHPDHAAGAEALAIPHDIPVLVAPGAGRDLPYRVHELEDGEPLPVDAAVTVRLGPLGSGRLELVEGSAGE